MQTNYYSSQTSAVGKKIGTLCLNGIILENEYSESHFFFCIHIFTLPKQRLLIPYLPKKKYIIPEVYIQPNWDTHLYISFLNIHNM